MARREDEFTLADDNLCCAIGLDLADVVDPARDVATQLGFRPWQVMRVWTRWTGSVCGEGIEEVAREEPILPTPAIDDGVTGLQALAQAINGREEGQLTITEVSMHYTEEELRGGELAANEAFFYEVRYIHRRDRTNVRRRFTLAKPPALAADEAAWTLTFTKQEENRSDAGGLGSNESVV